MPREMPASFRAALHAALARPVLLDPRAVDSVASAGSFRLRAGMDDDDGDSMFGGEPKRVAPFTREGDVAVVCVEGPLSQRAWSCWCFEGDGYDAITSRVQAALDDAGSRAVVLRLDSPGGEVAGCFEMVRALRAASAKAGKPLVAFVDEMAASAAYALAVACDEIVCPDTGLVGSVGVITAVCDESGALALEGVKVAVITSGAAKADGHPAIPLAEDARARIQADVNLLAEIFAAEVSAARPLTPAEVLALDARVFRGAQALDAKLVDRVGNFGAAVARARELAKPSRNTTNSSARRSASTTRTKTMEDATLKTLLGADSDASEAALVERLTALSALDRDVRAVTGAGDTESARGALRSLAKRAGEADAAEKALADERAAHRAEQRTALKREALAAGYLTPAELGADEKGEFPHAEGGFVAEMSNASLRGYIDREKRLGRSAVPQGEHRAPTSAPGADAQLPPDVAELAAKATRDGWMTLSADERARVQSHDQALANRLRSR